MVILYGAESWTMNNALRRAPARSGQCTTNEERDRYVWRSNEECRRVTKVKVVPIINKAKKSRLQYAAHAARGSAPPATCAACAMLDPTPHRPRSRPRGSPRKRLFFDPDAQDARSLNIAYWKEAAQRSIERRVASHRPRDRRPARPLRDSASGGEAAQVRPSSGGSSSSSGEAVPDEPA